MLSTFVGLGSRGEMSAVYRLKIDCGAVGF